MTSCVLDTGALACLLTDDPRLNRKTVGYVTSVDRVLVPSIAFYEIGQKVRLGKWGAVAHIVADLEQVAMDDGFDIVPLTAALAREAASFDWDHRDPFDRMIAATALAEHCPLVSSDKAFDALGIERIW